MTQDRTGPRTHRVAALFLGLLVPLLAAFPAPAQIEIANVPLFLTRSVPPLAMINLSNDNQLYFQAFPDYADLDGDGAANRTYTHSFDYYGYFDSYKCYTYSAGVFTPAGAATSKYCSGDEWSGNFLNWVAMARIDVVRRILYGGHRSTDTATSTVLERTYLPNDAHSWIRYYDGEDIAQLTPFTLPLETKATSTTAITVPQGRRNPGGTADSAGSVVTLTATGWNSTNHVQVGDQLIIQDASDDSIWMIGVVTSFTPSSNRVEVQVTGSAGVDANRNSWLLTNPSRRGVSFCNTTVSSTTQSQNVTDPPLIRVARGNYSLWTANERWQCRWSNEENRTGHTEMRIKGIAFSNGNDLHSSGIPANSDNPVRNQVGLGSQDYTARVAVCVDGLIGDELCKQYPNGNSKPIGLLQEYGEDGSIRFGLMTGSYQRNLGGGVLRKNISSFADEVNASTGILDGLIVNTLNAFRIYGYNHSKSTGLYSGAGDNCDVGVTRAQMTASPGTGVRCRNWGNPQAEIFLESIRYFAGKNSPTSAFTFTGSEGVSGLSTSNWRDPLSNDNWCAVSSIINFNASFNSFDGDQLGGFSDLASTGTLSDWTNKVGTGEGIAGASVFHGGTDALCTAKTVGNLADVSGICPEAPNQAGTFHIAGLAHYAWTNSIRTDLERDPQKAADIHLKTYGVSLAPAVPRIEIPRPGQTEAAVTILPACDNAYTQDGGLRCALADFRIIEQDIAAGTGRFFIQWDVHEWGSDFDMDINGTLSYRISGNHIDITTNTWAQSSSRNTGFGYILSGTTQDGFHAHSGINGYNYTDPTGILGCSNCRLDDPPTTVRYSLGAAQGRLLEDPVLLAAKWGGYNKAIDFPGTQTSWDRTGDGIPDNYFYAIDPEKIFDGLRDALDDIVERAQTSVSSAAASSAMLQDETLLYTAGFRSDGWSGTLIAREIQLDGTLLAPDLGEGWDAEKKLASRLPSARKIFTVSGESGIEFAHTNLNDEQRAALDHPPYGTVADGLGEKRVDWLRGTEDPALFRCRRPPLEGEPGQCEATGELRLIGDIVNSNPQFVPDRYTGASRLLGAPATRNRVNTLYIGANDGMLHAFDATSGDELFAFIPSELLEKEPGEEFAPLSRLMEPGYSHSYFVDGTPVIEEAQIAGTWKTVLVGSMGGGGRSVFALDVTDPAAFSASNVLWEFTDPDLGYNVGQPTIARLSNGVWAAIFGNGYNSVDHEAYLFVVRLSDGELIRKINTGVGSEVTPNGLASPKWTHWPKSDLKANTIYAGDLLGNLWKFDLSGTIATWPLFPKLLFTARDPGGAPQPITVRPAIASAPDDPDTLIVAFGTGSGFRATDGFPDPLTEGGPRPWPVQSLYGIRDTKGQDDYPLDRTKLSQQAIVDEQTIAKGGETYDLRVIDVPDDADPPDPPLLEARGWYLDLCLATSSGICDSQKLDGERVVSEASFPTDPVRGRIRFTTLIPIDDPCRGGRTGFLYDLSLLTGGRYGGAVFDLDGDGEFNKNDQVTFEGEDVPPSGIRFGTGERLTVIQNPGADVEYGYDGIGDKINLQGGGERSGRQSWQQLR